MFYLKIVEYCSCANCVRLTNNSNPPVDNFLHEYHRINAKNHESLFAVDNVIAIIYLKNANN